MNLKISRWTASCFAMVCPSTVRAQPTRLTACECLLTRCREVVLSMETYSPRGTSWHALQVISGLRDCGTKHFSSARTRSTACKHLLVLRGQLDAHFMETSGTCSTSWFPGTRGHVRCPATVQVQQNGCPPCKLRDVSQVVKGIVQVAQLATSPLLMANVPLR